VKLSFKQLTNSKNSEFSSRRVVSKNVTKMAWWWRDSFSHNTLNQGDRAGDIVAADVPVDCAVAEVK
jgi:hypothetical protein